MIEICIRVFIPTCHEDKWCGVYMPHIHTLPKEMDEKLFRKTPGKDIVNVKRNIQRHTLF